jgi:hypothetical protein
MFQIHFVWASVTKRSIKYDKYVVNGCSNVRRLKIAHIDYKYSLSYYTCTYSIWFLRIISFVFGRINMFTSLSEFWEKMKCLTCISCSYYINYFTVIKCWFFHSRPVIFSPENNGSGSGSQNFLITGPGPGPEKYRVITGTGSGSGYPLHP